MNTFFKPFTCAEEWKLLLADPEKQWKTGYSAKTLAESWLQANGFPPEVKQVLVSYDTFQSVELLLAIPEHEVALPGGKRPSQNDIWLLGKTQDGLVSIAVEGKVSEPFGPTIKEWSTDAGEGKRKRLEYLTSLLSVEDTMIDGIRYQLLHRTASSIIEAKRFRAKHAIMMVHSFSTSQEWFGDYQAFAALFDVDVQCDQIHKVCNISGVELFLAWINGDKRFLKI